LMILWTGYAYSEQHDFLHSEAHDLSEQQPLDASLEQHDFAAHAVLQSAAPPVAAHELSANAEIANADMKDIFWITFFIELLYCYLGDVLV
jgi:hypothetical protein